MTNREKTNDGKVEGFLNDKIEEDEEENKKSRSLSRSNFL